MIVGKGFTEVQMWIAREKKTTYFDPSRIRNWWSRAKKHSNGMRFRWMHRVIKSSYWIRYQFSIAVECVASINYTHTKMFVCAYIYNYGFWPYIHLSDRWSYRKSLSRMFWLRIAGLRLLQRGLVKISTDATDTYTKSLFYLYASPISWEHGTEFSYEMN